MNTQNKYYIILYNKIIIITIIIIIIINQPAFHNGKAATEESSDLIIQCRCYSSITILIIVIITMISLCSLQADELEYTFKRLVDGLAHTREAARPGFSLALGQVSANDRQKSFMATQHQLHLRLTRSSK